MNLFCEIDARHRCLSCGFRCGRRCPGANVGNAGNGGGGTSGGSTQSSNGATAAAGNSVSRR